jgi:hypothetical protein
VPELYNGTCYRLNKQLRSATPFLTCVLTHLIQLPRHCEKPCWWAGRIPLRLPTLQTATARSWLLGVDEKGVMIPQIICKSNMQPNCEMGFITRLKKKTKLHGLSPWANYTDWATAACRRSDCQLVRIEGAMWWAWRIPPAVFLGFLDRSRYFSIK